MMHTHDMMKAIASYRGDAILVPGRSGRYWITISDNQRRPLVLTKCSFEERTGSR